MKAIVVFDGVCNLCNGAVRFILKRDKKEIFNFSWLQSETGRRLYAEYKLDPEEENSLAVRQAGIVLLHGEKVFTRSAAVLQIAKMLGGGWVLFYPFILIPKFIRDGLYNFVARNRYRWFGKKNDCVLPDPKYRSRFLL